MTFAAYTVFDAQISCYLVALTSDLLTLSVSHILSLIRPIYVPILRILQLSDPQL